MDKNVFIIETERLTLRPVELSDLFTKHEYESDQEIKYMVWFPRSTVKETEERLKMAVAEWNKETPLSYEFAIILGDKHIGGVGIELDDKRQEGELGWIINKEYRKKGYATEAAKAVLDFAVNKLKLKKVFAHCDYRNEPSYKIMKSIGLSLERDDGVRRYRGTNQDVQDLMYSLIVSD